MNKELHVVVMPNGSLQTEWIETKETINKSKRLLQQEIFNRFTADAYGGLLYLGFCDKNITFTPSLEYWRSFAGQYVRKLSRIPELETLRHNVNIAVDKNQLIKFANSSPLMPGSEYITAELLETVWSKLNTAFTWAIKSYKGTVEEFIRTYSPDVHLVGRVYLIFLTAENCFTPCPGYRRKPFHF